MKGIFRDPCTDLSVIRDSVRPFEPGRFFIVMWDDSEEYISFPVIKENAND